MRIVELILDEEEMLAGVQAISIVEYPAIEENFVKLSKDQEIQLAQVDAEKRILMGPALIPNKTIYRKNGEDEYYIYFSKDTIRKVSEMFLTKGNQNKSTLEHQIDLQGLSVVESWIVEGEQDKSRAYGMDHPEGTWMVSMKVYNDEVWDKYVSTGKVKGFSIEGYFADKVNMGTQVDPEAEAEEMLEYIREELQKENLESYSDYPDAVSNNAKRGIELNEKVNNKCATQVGKIRAQQLAQKEPITVETIKRMYSYLSRAEEYYQEGDTEACGTISYLLWGGKAGLRWSSAKLKELGKLEASSQKVEMNKVNDAFGKYEQAEKTYNKAVSQVKTTINSFKRAEKLAGQAYAMLESLKKEAKELGAPAKLISQIDDIMKDSGETSRSANLWYDAIERLQD
jgi:hypothetical protein